MPRFSPFKKKTPQALLNVKQGPIALPPSGFSSQKQALIGRISGSISNASQADDPSHLERLSSSDNFTGNTPGFFLYTKELDARLEHNLGKQASMILINHLIESSPSSGKLAKQILENNKRLMENLQEEEQHIKTSLILRNRINKEALKQQGQQEPIR